jgi:transketolase
MAAYQGAFPDLARELRRRVARTLRDGWDADLPAYPDGSDDLATRNASQQVLQVLKTGVPELFGGAADLSESNLTDLKGEGDFSADEAGRNIRFGVREHGMGGIANGIAYHGGFIPYAGTFLNFSDYMRGSVRLAALSSLHVIYVWTHDSVGLGEDGPTHQPIEHYAALRAMPNLWFVRPGDPNEAVAAWHLAVARTDGPVALAFTRQKLPVLAGTSKLAREGLERGGYVLADASGDPQVILLATGSELHLAIGARAILDQGGIRARVVSMPCWERFAEQPAEYRERVLPRACTARLSVEAGSSLGWDRWVGSEGAMLAIERFGLSAPAKEIFERFGFTADHVAALARGVVDGTVRGVISPPWEHLNS